MAYLFNTPDQQREMLSSIGVSTIEELFSDIPPRVRLTGRLNLPRALAEMELQAHVSRLAQENINGSRRVCFLGGGAYDHFVPAVVDEVTARGEFYTAYTPYQAEASQGSLQAFFEFQTLICQLTGMEVANASLYEGGTALSEAVFMSLRVSKSRRRIVLLGSMNPQYRQVVDTYTRNIDCDVVLVEAQDGVCDPRNVVEYLNDQTACLVVQHPNYFGCLEDVEELVKAAHAVGALAIVSFNPMTLGLLRRPGEYGADIAVAEGQPLGIPLQYGGPYLGLFACREKFVRQMPGRLVGRARDRHGKPCYVLSLQTREQHIRREKATSNICTNQGLLALRATAYLAAVGPQGLREVAHLCCQGAHYAAERLTQIPGLQLQYQRPFFHEFVLRCADGLLVAVTEQRTRSEIDALAEALEAR